MLLGLAALGLVAATAAGRLGRFWWFADLFSHFVSYYVLAGLLLTAVLLLFRRRRIALLAMVGLAVNTALLFPQWGAGFGHTGHRGIQRELRLVHLNVLRPNRDRDSVVRFLNTCGADAVFVQEASPWWVDTLHDADIPYREVAVSTGDKRFGILMLARKENETQSSDANHYVSSRLIGLVADEVDRPGIEAVFEVAGRRITVLSVHPAQPINAGLTALRDDMLRATKAWADRQSGPHIVIGDMNTTPWSYAFAILTHDKKLVSTLDGRGNQGTWPADSGSPLLLPIDHCLYSPGLVCTDRHVGPFVGSDHLPLSVTLAFNPDGMAQVAETRPFETAFTAMHAGWAMNPVPDRVSLCIRSFGWIQ